MPTRTRRTREWAPPISRRQRRHGRRHGSGGSQLRGMPPPLGREVAAVAAVAVAVAAVAALSRSLTASRLSRRFCWRAVVSARRRRLCCCLATRARRGGASSARVRMQPSDR